MNRTAAANFGRCALCREERPLCDSHLMPKWVYRRLQKAAHDKSAPVFVSDGSAVLTSAQVTQHLLCDDCERRFGTREDYVARITETDSDGKINLARFISRPPNTRGKLVLIDNEVATDKIAYFAASVIWRACVMNYGCRLGRYEVDFRDYLLGKAEFPSVAAISMAILETPLSTSIRPEYWATMPGTVRAGAVWVHGFLVAGLAFRCHVGGALDTNMQKVCLIRSDQGKYAMMLPGDQLCDFQAAMTVGAAAVPRGKLRNYFHSRLSASPLTGHGGG